MNILTPSVPDGGTEWLRRADVRPHLRTLLVLD